MSEVKIVKEEWIRCVDRLDLGNKVKVKYLFIFLFWMILGEKKYC